MRRVRYRVKLICACIKWLAPLQSNANEILTDCFMASKSPSIPKAVSPLIRADKVHAFQSPAKRTGDAKKRHVSLKRKTTLKNHYDGEHVRLSGCSAPLPRAQRENLNIASGARNIIVIDSSFL